MERELKFRSLPKYEPEKRSEIYLALNENPYDFPDEILEKVFKTLNAEKLKIYYDSPSDELLKALARYTGQPEKRISIGNGADEIIYDIFLMFPNMKFYVCPPTYSCYFVFASVTGVKLNYVPLIGEMYERLNLEELTKILNEDSVLFLPNPNNPTGHLFEKSDIERLLSTGALIALDEAYYEFSNVSYVELLDKFDNLIIIRTFSKAFSLAAQRIGYILANEELIEYYNSLRLPYNVSYISQQLALAALENLAYFKKRTSRIVQERERMKEILSKNGFKLTDSKANFVFILTQGDEARDIVEKLERQNITVRKFEQGIRISIGKSEENDLVINALIGKSKV